MLQNRADAPVLRFMLHVLQEACQFEVGQFGA